MSDVLSDWELTAFHQKFSLPETLIYYIAKNPLSPESYNKLIQCCKYFWLKNRMITLHGLFLHNEDECWKTIKSIELREYQKVQIENMNDNLWIYWYLLVSNEENQLMASSIIPKIYRCDLTHLNLELQTVSFDDFQTFTSSGCLKSLYLKKTTVKNDVGSVVPIETLIELLPKLYYFNYVNVPGDEGLQTITSETAANLVAIPHFPQIKQFIIQKIPESFDFEAFFATPKGSMEIDFRFAGSISEAYKEKLQTFMDDVLAQGLIANRPPIILFHGMNHETFYEISLLRRDYDLLASVLRWF